MYVFTQKNIEELSFVEDSIYKRMAQLQRFPETKEVEEELQDLMEKLMDLKMNYDTYVQQGYKYIKII